MFNVITIVFISQFFIRYKVWLWDNETEDVKYFILISFIFTYYHFQYTPLLYPYNSPYIFNSISINILLLGASAAAGAFSPEILRAMATFNDRPIVFALSNPTSKAECTAEQAYVNTDVILYCRIQHNSKLICCHFRAVSYSPAGLHLEKLFWVIRLSTLVKATTHIYSPVSLWEFS